MAIVQSFGALQAMTPPAMQLSGSDGGVRLYGHRLSYANIYAQQPNVRTCVDFLARNIAQLGLHTFRRVSDTDRVRLHGHDLNQWLDDPNPTTVGYRLMESMVADMGIYFNAYWLKVRYVRTDNRPAIGLVRLPPDEMEVKGSLLPTHYVWKPGGRQGKAFDLSEIVHFDGYNPLNPLMGLSPLDTLRRVLAEEAAAGEHREGFWRNAARIDGVIERPLAAPRWTPEQKTSWREQWQARFAGGAGSGQTAVLEDGMVFKNASFSAKESEYSVMRKLSREECAAAYHIPLPMVGILEHATFSNIKEQHKHLYQDCLGPWLELFQQVIAAQLLTECEDQADVYLEFNIAAKLAGSFEEQSSSLSTLVGRPIMTANEGRARLNLPAMQDDPSADALAEQQGGPAAGFSGAPRPPGDRDAATSAHVTQVLRAHWNRQASRLSRLPTEARAEGLNHARCTIELATDLLPILGTDAYDYALRVTTDTYQLLLGGVVDAFRADRKAP